MKTVSKKLLSFMLVAILLVSALPFQAFATELEAPSAEAPVTAETTVVTEAPTAAPTEAPTAAPTAAPTEAPTAAPTEAPTAAPAPATPIKHDGSHAGVGVWVYDADDHYFVCRTKGCEYEDTAVPATIQPHTYGSDGTCTVCGRKCDHTVTHDEIIKQPTCTATGIAHKVCSKCGVDTGVEVTVAALGHDFVNGKCTRCAATAPNGTGKSYTLVLSANGGTISTTGGTEISIPVVDGEIIGTLPDAVLGGARFLGWYLADGVTKIESGSVYKFDANVTAYAKFETKTNNLTVYRILNGNNATATQIFSQNVPENTPLLSYLETNVKAAVNASLTQNPGYRWTNVWQDYSGRQLMISQTDCMNQAQTVYVNFVPNTYTLHFNANGGTVSVQSKQVTFGTKVGTLPTPYRDGKVFQGWKDQNGNTYTAETILQAAGDVSLTASWQDKANVMLYIYVNGDFSGVNRVLPMDEFVSGNNLTRAQVVNQIARYYAPTYGSSLSVAGLFDDNTWNSYRANTSKAGTDSITVGSNTTRVYVMVNNAATGTILNPTTPTVTVPTTSNGYWLIGANGSATWVSTSSVPQGAQWVSTGNGGGYWIYNPNGVTNPTVPTYIIIPGTNPKTGDTAKIEVAAAVMVLAAAALVTMLALRKKKA